MRIAYHRDVDVLYIKLRDRPAIDSEHIEEMGIVLDYDEHNQVVGIEIWGWSERQKKGEELN
ncbi:MAG: DUF2283 domain-containing protein, partial [Aquificota bacterium]